MWLAMMVVATTACPAKHATPRPNYQTIVLRPEHTIMEGKQGCTFSFSVGEKGEISIKPDAIKPENLIKANWWDALPVYTYSITGVEGSKPINVTNLSIAEKALIEGIYIMRRDKPGSVRPIVPLSNAIGSIEMMLSRHNVLPTGDHGLLFLGESPAKNRTSAFQTQSSSKQYVNAIPFFNPLTNSLIRVNPPEASSPGDIYLTPIKLNDAQLSAVQSFTSDRKLDPSKAYIITVYGTTEHILLRGLFFPRTPVIHSSKLAETE